MVPAVLRTSARVLSRFVRLIIRRPRTAALGARMALWLVLVSVAARMTSLPRTFRLMTFGVNRSRPRAAPADAVLLARTIDSVLRLDLAVFKPRCWKRSLVLYRYLTRLGITCSINFGVRRTADGALAGHAWLERDGLPFLESDATIDSYIVTFTLPGPGDDQAAAAIRHGVTYDAGR